MHQGAPRSVSLLASYSSMTSEPSANVNWNIRRPGQGAVSGHTCHWLHRISIMQDCFAAHAGIVSSSQIVKKILLKDIYTHKSWTHYPQTVLHDAGLLGCGKPREVCVLHTLSTVEHRTHGWQPFWEKYGEEKQTR